MAGITNDVIELAMSWLQSHGHSMSGIAYAGEGGDEARGLAAVALYLNVFKASEPETCRLIVDCIAHVRSGGRACPHIAELAGKR